MLKDYVDRNNSSISQVNHVSSASPELCEQDLEDMHSMNSDSTSSRLQNTGILKNLEQKLSHLEPDQRKELKQVIIVYEHLFRKLPLRQAKFFMMWKLMVQTLLNNTQNGT